MKKLAKVFFIFSLFFFVGLSAQAQTVSLDSAVDQVRNIGSSVAGIVGGIVGLLGIGRAAYKFSHGDTDAITALIAGIVGLVLGQIAAGML